jgi:peptidoglycan/LPS O-acetylase OafA/YrhL
MGVLSPPSHTTEVSPPPGTRFHSPLLKREMPGLDTLRGVAVLAVVTYHGLHWWLPPATSISPGVKLLSSLASPGWLGVNLFFVLSGFLITGILLETRTRPDYWRNFYTRRILRIFPLYFVVLLILRLQGISWTYLLLSLFYLSNFTVALHVPDNYGPLWSLAVEEQFYLIWPLLVRRLSSRTLAIVCLGSISLSPLLRFLSASRIVPLGDPYSTTWLVSDNLAAGALIAILLRSPLATTARVRTATAGLALLGTVFLALGFHLHLMSRSTAAGSAFQSEPFLLLFAAALLLSLQYGDHPRVLRVTGPLRFYGYISYGLYLLHLIAFWVYLRLFPDPPHLRPELTVGLVLLRLCTVLGATTLICLLSRRYFEEYFLRWKDRLVPYTGPKRP